MKTISEITHHISPMTIIDDEGNLIYWEHLDDYWEKREYDPNGNVIYYESSTRYWWRCQRDSNGTRTYFEDSTGYVEGDRE